MRNQIQLSQSDLQQKIEDLKHNFKQQRKTQKELDEKEQQKKVVENKISEIQDQLQEELQKLPTARKSLDTRKREFTEATKLSYRMKETYFFNRKKLIKAQNLQLEGTTIPIKKPSDRY